MDKNEFFREATLRICGNLEIEEAIFSISQFLYQTIYPPDIIKTKGKVNEPEGVADLLGINPSTLRNRMRKLGIDYRRQSKS